MKKIRNISDCELMFCDVQETINSYTMQILLEFSGNVTIHEIEQAINEIVYYNPECNVFKNRNYWITSDEKINVKSLTFESKISLFDEDFFNQIVDFNKRSMELYLINISNDKSKYLVFKFFHGSIDGKGAMLIIENFINIICSKKIHVIKNDVSNKDFLKELNFYNEKINLKPKYIFKKINKIDNYKLEWNIVVVKNIIPNIIPKISKTLQKYFVNDNVVFMIPVDLRYYNQNIKRVGNLILPIYLDVNKDDNVDTIKEKFLWSLKSKKALNMYNAKAYNYHIYPEKFRRFVINKLFKRIINKNRFFVGGIISHLGAYSFNKSSKIAINNIIFLPNHQPLTPITILTTEYNGKTTFSICNYKNQIPKDILKNIIQDLKGLK